MQITPVWEGVDRRPNLCSLSDGPNRILTTKPEETVPPLLGTSTVTLIGRLLFHVANNKADSPFNQVFYSSINYLFMHIG